MSRNTFEFISRANVNKVGFVNEIRDKTSDREFVRNRNSAAKLFTVCCVHLTLSRARLSKVPTVNHIFGSHTIFANKRKSKQ